MNYRTKLYDVLHRNEIDVIRQHTTVANRAIDHLTVSELRELRPYLVVKLNSPSYSNDALDVLALIIERSKLLK